VGRGGGLVESLTDLVRFLGPGGPQFLKNATVHNIVLPRRPHGCGFMLLRFHGEGAGAGAGYWSRLVWGEGYWSRLGWSEPSSRGPGR
jgi:hypothetical protein